MSPTQISPEVITFHITHALLGFRQSLNESLIPEENQIKKMEKIIITKDFVKKVHRFNLEERTIEFKIKPIPEDEEPVGWIRDAINQVIARGTEGLESGDKVGFSFCGKEFKRGEGCFRFRPVEEIIYDDVWDVISNVYQFNYTGLNTEAFCLGITSVRMPAGGQGKDRVRKNIIPSRKSALSVEGS